MLKKESMKKFVTFFSLIMMGLGMIVGFITQDYSYANHFILIGILNFLIWNINF